MKTPSPRTEPQGRDSAKAVLPEVPDRVQLPVSRAGDAWNRIDLLIVLALRATRFSSSAVSVTEAIGTAPGSARSPLAARVNAHRPRVTKPAGKESAGMRPASGVTASVVCVARK